MVVLASLLIPTAGVAEVAIMVPENIVLVNWPGDRDLIFVLFLEGEFEKGVILDPKKPDPWGQLRLPPKGVPVGELAVLGVPRELAEKSEQLPDPAWLHDPAAGIVRVAGAIHTNPVEKHSALHQYELRVGAAGLEVILLNPDVLQPFAPEIAEAAAPPIPWQLWGIAAGSMLFLAGALAWYGFRVFADRSGPD
jgi:hypothetical protein